MVGRRQVPGMALPPGVWSEPQGHQSPPFVSCMHRSTWDKTALCVCWSIVLRDQLVSVKA